MKVRLDRRTIPRVRFVITTARAERPRPAGGAVRLVRDVMLDEKLVLTRMVDPVEHAAELVFVRPWEAVAERDVPVRRNAHQPEPGAARVRLAHALVNLF